MTPAYSVVSVEDDYGIFVLIQITLRSLPLKLYHARTGQEAIALVSELNPDLLVLDIALPDIQGWEVLKKIKEMDVKLKGVVVLSARVNSPHDKRALEQNVSACMPKPFVPAELRNNVREILGLAA